MDGGTALGWVCDNKDWIGPVLAVVLPASIVSGWADRMPPWLAHLVNGLGLNWGDIFRTIVAKLTNSPPPPGAGKQD